MKVILCTRCGHRAELHGIQSEEIIWKLSDDATTENDDRPRYFCAHQDENGKCHCEGYLAGREYAVRS